MSIKLWFWGVFTVRNSLKRSRWLNLPQTSHELGFLCGFLQQKFLLCGIKLHRKPLFVSYCCFFLQYVVHSSSKIKHGLAGLYITFTLDIVRFPFSLTNLCRVFSFFSKVGRLCRTQVNLEKEHCCLPVVTQDGATYTAFLKPPSCV